MQYPPQQQSELEPLCDTGRPAGVISLISWALGLLVIWGILLLAGWKLLTPLYQDDLGPQPPQSATTNLVESSPGGH